MLALAQPVAWGGDGRVKWFTIESEHFIVSYHDPLHAVAERVALVAERAHEELALVMGHEPDEKTFIVLDDTTDGTNGFASVLPRNAIRLFTSAPPSKSDLADHDDFLYALVMHEYAHILHLDNIDGLPKYVNKVIGKTWAPNQVQPRWVIEGIATYEESQHSSGGRLRHALFSTLLRMATLQDDERELDEMSNGPRTWPQGNTAYLYGSNFLKYVFDRFGEDKLAEMSYNYGSSPIPYGLNRSIRKATGLGFTELHKDWKKHRRDRYAMEEEAVLRRGRREGRRLTFTSQANLNPRYTRDGSHIIWQYGPGDERGRLAIIPSGGNAGQLRTYAIIERSGEFDVLSDGSLVLEQTDTYRATYTSQELFRWDFKTKELQRLTTRRRLRDPAVSPDEHQVAFVMTAQSKRRLAVMDLRPEAVPRVVWDGPGQFDQAFDPAWSPDGKKIAFSAFRTGGYRDILIVDLETGELRELAKDRAHDVDPVWDPSGELLYYASDRTGIFNIFAYHLRSGRLQQVTNVVGCAVGPALSPDGKRLAYQGCVARGFELYEMHLDPAGFLEAPLYVNDRPDPAIIRRQDYPISEVRDYEPLKTLAPDRYDLQLDGVNRRLNLQLVGNDIVGLHRYNLGGTTDLETGRIDIGGSYSYNRNWASFRAAGSRTLAQRGGFIINDRNTPYLEERLGATLSVGLPVLRKAKGSGSLSLAYDFDYLHLLKDQFDAPDPNDSLPRKPETDVALAGLALRFSYSDTQGYVFGLGPQLGRSLSLSMRLNHPALGSDFRSLNLDYRFETYYRLPFGKTPVLSLRVNGGIRVSDRARTSRFSLGGVPEQDLVVSILESLRTGSTGFLRGYAPGSVSGTQMHLANIEYRQELWNIEHGVQTLPFYLQKLHIAGLFDVGNAFDDNIDVARFKTSLGVSLRLNMLIGYFVPGSLDIGYAHGLSEGGVGEFWTLLTGSL